MARDATLVAAKMNYPFVLEFQTVAGTANQDTAVLGFVGRVVNAWAFMTGAGAAGDTVKIQKVAPGPTATDISDAVDVSAKADKAYFTFGTLDDAQYDFTAADFIRVVQASDALCRVYVECICVTAPYSTT